MSDENEVELYLDFSGWVRLSHDTRMQYIGVDESKPEIITVLEWSKLSDDEQGLYMLRLHGVRPLILHGGFPDIIRSRC